MVHTTHVSYISVIYISKLSESITIGSAKKNPTKHLKMTVYAQSALTRSNLTI